MIQYLPEVERPLKNIPLKERLRNTFAILVAYLLLMNTKLPTISQSWLERYKVLQYLYGTKFGSVVTVGTSAIVLGGLTMEILVLKKIIDIDINTAEGKDKMMKYQKAMIIFFTIYLGIVYALRMSVPTPGAILFTAIMFIFGGFIVYLMDDYITKYGVGSGISWFILLSVSSSVFAGFFDPTKDLVGRYNGFIWKIIDYFINPQATTLYGDPGEFFMNIVMPVIMTIVILFIVVFFERSTIVLSNSRVVRDNRQRLYNLPSFKVKFTYISVMPIIFAIFSIEFITLLFLPFKNTHIGYLATRYLSMPYGYLSWFDPIHWLVYSLVFIGTGLPLAIWFSRATNFSDDKIDQILKVYFPQFKRVEAPAVKRARMIMKSFPYISSIIVITIALIGNFFGILGSGSGIILLVAITLGLEDYIKEEMKREGIKINGVRDFIDYIRS